MATEGKADRQYYIDWLRVVAILTVFLFHTGRFFTVEDWHVHDADSYPSVDLLLKLVSSWGMPFLFVVSGASTWYALGKRRAGAFFKDRSLRLMVPLVAGIFTHAALQVYLERLTHGDFSGTFWQFYPHYFEGWMLFGGNFAWMGMHLWYLEALLILTVVSYPLMAWLRRGSGAGLLARFNRFLARPGAVYLLALPVYATTFVSEDSVPGATILGGWSLALLFCFFLLGFILVADEGLQASVERQRWISLGIGVISMASFFAIVILRGEPEQGMADYPSYTAVAALNAWCWVLVMWGFARRHLNFGTPLLWLMNEAVLPFYILHQTVLLCIGFFVVQWPIPDLLKWLVILVTSFAATVAIYWLLVRPFNVMRFLFGMKPQPRKAVAPTQGGPRPVGVG